MSAPTTAVEAPTAADFLADAQQRLDDLLPHLRPGSAAFELHRIAAGLAAAVRALTDHRPDDTRNGATP